MAEHLGGHNWVTHVDHGAMEFIFKQGYKTMIDVGCGPGGAVTDARGIGFKAIGIDGDIKLDHINQEKFNKSPESLPFILFHDYTQGVLPDHLSWGNLTNTDLTEFDVGWCVEFLEHVEEKYIPNIMDTFRRCKIVVATHALPGDTGGWHHVNLQSPEYWIKKFEDEGFIYDELKTLRLKKHSTMGRDFLRKTGKVFVRFDEKFKWYESVDSQNDLDRVRRDNWT